MIAFLVGYGLMLLTVLAICSDSKRREIEQARPTVADEAEAYLRRLP